MTLPMHTLAARALSTAFFGAVLVACGGGSTSDQANATAASTTAQASLEGTRSLSVLTSRGVTTATPSNGTAPVSIVTDVRFENTSATATQSAVPVTFGQVFAPGDLLKGTTLNGRLENGQAVPLQVDVKALHADGSVRHAIVSAILPRLDAGQVLNMKLERSSASAAPASAGTAQLLASGFTASASATIGGLRYTVSADELIKSGAVTAWLSGPVVNEWHVSAPLTTASGARHPHLSARFAVRWYSGAAKARVDVTIENNWTYEPAPQNFVYDAQILVGAKPVFTEAALTHYHHARWRKLFWWGGEAPAVNVKHNTAYLIGTRAVANYDQSLSIADKTLAALGAKWDATKAKTLGIGLAVPYMPQTGGRDDLGLLPAWSVMYLLSMDKRAAEATMGTADKAGSWSAHYRDKNTGQPVSLIDYPYMTIAGTPTDAYNRATRKSEAFPKCAASGACKSPYAHDVAHQASFAYLPYLVTGDHYYLEELQFWAMYNVFSGNPGYRKNIQGLVKPEQLRGQAWALRTLAHAAYITPDSDRLKEHFNRVLDSNLDYYNATYTTNPNANKLGIIVDGYSVVYDGRTGIAPWMDDFFTSAVGHIAELGYPKAVPLLQWKAQFPVSRMVGEGACYIRASMYSMVVRESQTGPFFTSIARSFQASDDLAGVKNMACASPEMAAGLKLKAGEMMGYSSSPAGYPSNMQPALAYSAGTGANGAKAWALFMSRSVKPNYATAPQFAILPR